MKHTKIKSFIAACLAAATAAGCVSFSAYAQNEEFGGNYAIEDPDDYQRYLDSLTDEQRRIIEEKEKLAADFNGNPFDGIVLPKAPIYIDVPGTFTIYQQETDSYCVPACIQSVLMYFKGTSPSQKNIQNFVNMYVNKIPEYINPLLGQQAHTYIFCQDEDLSEKLTYLISLCVASNKAPAFLRIRTDGGEGGRVADLSNEDDWPYVHGGHCVICCGMRSDASEFRIADPMGGRLENLPSSYTKRAEYVVAYTTSICW